MLCARHRNGSITVEASLVLPIFIFAVTAFLYFFQIILVQENIQHAMSETGKCLSETAFIYEYVQKYNKEDSMDENGKNTAVEIIDSVVMKTKMKDFIEESVIENSCILGGMSGIIMSESSFLKEKDVIDIVAMYRFKIPLPILSIKDIPIVQRVKVRAFTGYKPSPCQDSQGNGDNEGEDRLVYITQTGTVYHLTRECSHIKLEIKQLKYCNVEQERNENGGKYKSCEQCTRNQYLEGNENVYITTHGDRYHIAISCSGLKRSITQIPLSQVHGKTPCSRCGK